MPTQTRYVNSLRMDPSEHAAIKKAVAAECRRTGLRISVNAWIMRTLMDAVRRNGKRR